MKKLLISLAATLILGMTATVFAEEAPAKVSEPIKIRGKVEYTHSKSTTANSAGKTDERTSDGYVLQLDPKSPRVWIEGKYGKFNIRLGKMALLTNEDGLVWDTDFSGAQFTFGNVLKFIALGGRIAANKLSDNVFVATSDKDEPIKFVGVNLQYENPTGLSGGVGWYVVRDHDFKTDSYLNNIYSANLSCVFSDKFSISGSFAQDVMADNEKYSWQAVVDYAPLKNIGVKLKYFKGKDLEYGINVKNIWGRAEIFFLKICATK